MSVYPQQLQATYILDNLLADRHRDGRVRVYVEHEIEAAIAKEILQTISGKSDIASVNFVTVPNAGFRYELSMPRAEAFRLRKQIVATEMAQHIKPVEHLSTELVDSPKPRRSPRMLRSGDSGPDRSKSEGDFMVPLAGLEPVFDLCERLKWVRNGNATGEFHKYLSSRGLHGLRFDNESTANWAIETLNKLLGERAKGDETISLHEEIVRHKPRYWVQVPSALTNAILTDADMLSALCQESVKQFRESLDAPTGEIRAILLDQAKKSRQELVDYVTTLGFDNNSKLAAEMARRVLDGTRLGDPKKGRG